MEGRPITYKQSCECVDISDIYRGQKNNRSLSIIILAGKQLHDDAVPVQAVLPNWGRRPFPAASQIRNVQVYIGHEASFLCSIGFERDSETMILYAK